MNKIRKSLATILVATCALFMLSGCSAGVEYTDHEDMSLQKSLGQTSSITDQFTWFFMFTNWGPYEIDITPLEVVTVNVNEKERTCVHVQYLVKSTEDDKPANYATCVIAFNILDENLERVENDIWWVDDQGTQFADPRDGTLDIGVVYDFWVPIKTKHDDGRLTWITVSDRDGYFLRRGNTYWYKVN